MLIYKKIENQTFVWFLIEWNCIKALLGIPFISTFVMGFKEVFTLLRLSLVSKNLDFQFRVLVLNYVI